MRVGIGYDVHKLAEGRDLILGGVKIPFEKGLLGHSDADVLLHAIMDALLGAAAMGDIGQLFPDSDDAYKGADSLRLLKKVADKIYKAGYIIMNVDAVLMAQAPKIAPYIPEMKEKTREALRLEPYEVSIKGTTTEGLGFVGEGLGMASQAVASIEYIEN